MLFLKQRTTPKWYNVQVTRYSYTAERGGEIYKGVAEAQDRFGLYEVVRHEGGRVLSVTELQAHGFTDLSYWTVRLSRVKEHDKIVFARNLSAMLSAGLPLARALTVLERQAKNRRFAEVIMRVSEEVRKGNILNAALAKFPAVFSALFVAMIRAGEEGGTLPNTLATLADQMERSYTLKKKIRGAMIYPAIVLFAIIVIAALMMIYVVPTLAATFRDMNVTLPLTTRVILGISDFLSHYSLISFLLLFIGVAGIAGALRTELGKRALDTILLHLPHIGEIVREVNAARTTRTLSSLLSSGVDVLGSLDFVAGVLQNLYFRDVVQHAKKSVGQGEPLSAAFARAEHLYPPLVGEMIAVGEETGALPDMLQRVALFYEDEVERKTKDLSTIVEPLLMLIVGSGVGFFAVSMITPIYQISQNIH